MADAIDRVLAADGALPALETRAEAFLAAALRSVWSGRLWVSGGDLAGGLGRWLFFVQCARICCGPGPVNAAEFAEAYHPWRRFASNRTVSWALEKARPALVDLFLAAG